ncbi:hypothetical protein, partial [Nonomuraea wenchangensis]
ARQEDGAEAVRGRARQEDGARRKGGKRRMFGREDAVQEAASQQTALREAALREAALREATLREATHGAGQEPAAPEQLIAPQAHEQGRAEASAPEQGELTDAKRGDARDREPGTASARERDETQTRAQVPGETAADAETGEAHGHGAAEGQDVRGGTVVPIRSGQGRKSAGAAKPIDTEALRRLRRLAASADAPSDAAARADARTDAGERVDSERHEDEVARDQHRKGQPPRLGPALVLPGPHRAWPPLDPNAKPLPRPPAPHPEQPARDADTGAQASSGGDAPGGVTATGAEDGHGAAAGEVVASGAPADAPAASPPAADAPEHSSLTASGAAAGSGGDADAVSGDAVSGESERPTVSGNTGSTETTEDAEDVGSTAPARSTELTGSAEAAGSSEAHGPERSELDAAAAAAGAEAVQSTEAVRSTGAHEPERSELDATAGAAGAEAVRNMKAAQGTEAAQGTAASRSAEDAEAGRSADAGGDGDVQEGGERGRRSGGWPRLAPVAPDVPAPAHRAPELPVAPAAHRAPELPVAPAAHRAPELPAAPAAHRGPERPVAPLRGRPGAPADGRSGDLVAPVPGPRPGEGRVRRVESVVGRDSGGWRRIAQVVVGGSSVRTDGSEIDEARARAVFGGSRRILVLGCTGGAGQSTTALMLGHTFAQYRDDRVVAVDANTGGDTLTSRIEPETPETLTSLLSGLDRVSGYLTMRGYTTRTASGLEVISADTDAGAEQRLADRSLFSDHRLGESMRLLDRHYKLAVIDPAAALAARLLPYADQLVLVVPASEEASEAVAMTYEWLDGHGCAELRRRAVMVVNGVSRRSMADVEQAESVARGRCRAIVRVPWEDDLAPGGAEVVDPGQLRAAGRRAYLALAGVVVAGFAAQTARTAQSAQSVRPSDEELASDPPGTRIGER